MVSFWKPLEPVPIWGELNFESKLLVNIPPGIDFLPSIAYNIDEEKAEKLKPHVVRSHQKRKPKKAVRLDQ